MNETTAESSGLLLKNGNVLDYLPVDMKAAASPRVETVDLRIVGDRIVERGTDLAPQNGQDVVDLKGATVMPGHINGHHHLYSALAPGMPAPANTPRSFEDVLTEIWWKLDRSLDAESIYLSSVAGCWDALRCGTTLIFDHHSSLTCVSASLDHVERGMRDVGVRGCLCYETTDRGGLGGRDTTIEENRRYLQKVRDTKTAGVPWYRGLVGAHASFTLECRTLERLSELCDEFDVGIHIHLAEGPTDRELSHDRGWPAPLERLDKYNLVRKGSLLAHGVDLTPLDLQLISQKGAWLVHNGRSNMNNGVGRAAVDRFGDKSCFGTDGLDGNMWGEMRTTFYRGNETGRGPLGFENAEKFWIGGYRLAREIFGEPFGSLDAGAPADFLVCGQNQKCPMTQDNWLSLTMFGFHPWDIVDVYVGGLRRFRRGDPTPYDGQACREAAQRIWTGMQNL